MVKTKLTKRKKESRSSSSESDVQETDECSSSSSSSSSRAKKNKTSGEYVENNQFDRILGLFETLVSNVNVLTSNLGQSIAGNSNTAIGKSDAPTTPSRRGDTRVKAAKANVAQIVQDLPITEYMS